MYGKVLITCRACNCSMELDISRKIGPEIRCQSCGQVLSKVTHGQLSSAMEAIRSLQPIESDADGFTPEGKGFRITLNVYPPVDDPVS